MNASLSNWKVLVFLVLWLAGCGVGEVTGEQNEISDELTTTFSVTVSSAEPAVRKHSYWKFLSVNLPMYTDLATVYSNFDKQKLKELGIHTLRVPGGCSADVYDWSAAVPLDVLFSAASANDISIVATLTGGPVFLEADGQRLDQDLFIERWEYFVQAAVTHFGEQVDYWEIGRAVNSSAAMTSFLAPLAPGDVIGPDPVFYSRILKTASKIIKEGDPNDEVWLGSLTGLAARDCAMNPLTFLLELNAARGWRFADAILYEPWQGSTAPEFSASGTVNSACASNLMITPNSMSDEVAAVQELARQLGGKTVIVTGLGWQRNDLDALSKEREVSPGQVEADLLVRATAALMAKNTIATIFWHSDIANNTSSRNAMKNLTEVLSDSAPVGEVQDGEVYEYRFRQGGRNILIAWRKLDGDNPSAVALDVGDIPSLTAWAADSADITQGAGLKIPANNANRVTVMLNERPVIFIGRSGDLADSFNQTIHDQIELWGLDLQKAALRGLNEAKGELTDLVEKWFEEAKDSAIEWGEEKIDELLP